MAVTKIHNIKATVGRAIKYVTNPDKTDEYALVDFLNCNQATAEYSFLKELELANKPGSSGYTKSGKNANQAFHLIQSFKPEETNPEQAHKIGLELVEQMLEGKYTAVIGTHVDKDHIHNHIVFCAVDNIDHKRYHDCRESYKNIRKLSDKLCEENGLSVITEEKNLATSYKEWQERKKGNSWKQQLKEDINNIIRTAKNYDDFIDKMREKGYQIKGAALDGSEGKYISYLCPGQGENGRWIRGKKTSGYKGLGEDFSREKINERIEKRAKQRADRIKILATRTQHTDLIDTNTEKFKESPGLQRWADRENLKRMSAAYGEMLKQGFKTRADVAEKIAELEQLNADRNKELKDLSEDIITMGKIVKYVNQYKQNKRYFNAYQNSVDQERYMQNRLPEITLFQEAERILKRSGIDPEHINIDKLKSDYYSIEQKKEKLNKEITTDTAEIKKLNKFLSDFQTFMGDQSKLDNKKAQDISTSKRRGGDTI